MLIYQTCRELTFLDEFGKKNIELTIMGDYGYHELRPFISYFPCHWVVPVDFIVR